MLSKHGDFGSTTASTSSWMPGTNAVARQAAIAVPLAVSTAHSVALRLPWAAAAPHMCLLAPVSTTHSSDGAVPPGTAARREANARFRAYFRFCVLVSALRLQRSVRGVHARRGRTAAGGAR